MPLTREHVAGCLIGECVGDALGAPAEGSRAAAADWVAIIRREGPGGALSRGVGQYTDDSQLTRELMISCIERRRFDAEHYAGRVARLFAENLVVGAGWASQRAATRLTLGMPWDMAGEPPPSAGNGTAMRAAPVGLLHWDDQDALVEAAHLQGYCTHRDPRCSAGSVGIAAAVAHIATNEVIDAVRLCDHAASLAAQYDEPFAADIRILPQYLHEPPHKAAAQIARAGHRPAELEKQPYHWEGISPFVVPTVLWSMYAFLCEPDDFLKAVLLTIEPGGDTDTTAAITGALAGTRHGPAGIPVELFGCPRPGRVAGSAVARARRAVS